MRGHADRPHATRPLSQSMRPMVSTPHSCASITCSPPCSLPSPSTSSPPSPSLSLPSGSSSTHTRARPVTSTTSPSHASPSLSSAALPSTSQAPVTADKSQALVTADAASLRCEHAWRRGVGRAWAGRTLHVPRAPARGCPPARTHRRAAAAARSSHAPASHA